EQVDQEAANRVLWAGWLRRNGRMVWRTLSEVDLPVKVATGVLLCVILLSTLVFRFGTTKYSVPKAFFRSVSIMATGAALHAPARAGRGRGRPGLRPVAGMDGGFRGHLADRRRRLDRGVHGLADQLPAAGPALRGARSAPHPRQRARHRLRPGQRRLPRG